MNSKRLLSLEQQLSYVRRYGESSTLFRVGFVSALCGVGGLISFTYLASEPAQVAALFCAGVCLIVSLAMFTHLPQLKRAARAIRAGRRAHGVLHLSVDHSDSDSPSYEGSIREHGGTWNLKFGTPMGWTPESGAWPCEIVFVSDERGPVLVILEHGLLFPTMHVAKTYGPKR